MQIRAFRLKNLFSLAKETLTEWSNDEASTLAAALSYYALFSVAPLLLIVIAIAGLMFGEEAVRGNINGQISGLIGQDSAKVVESMMASTATKSGGVIATVVGIATLLFGATGVFAQLQDSLNVIWKAKPKVTSGLLAFLRQRFLSFTMVLGIGFLLLVSLVLSAALAVVGKYLGDFVPGWVILGHLINILVSVGFITVLFAMIYKLLPDTPIAWKDVWLGALVTSILFTLGKFLIGLYLGRASVASGYGAAGSLVILLLWVYYSSMLLFIGAEFTQVYSRRHGTRRDETH